MSTINIKQFRVSPHIDENEDLLFLEKQSTPLILAGVALAILGVLAISFSVFSTMASIVAIGVILLAAAATELVHAFSRSRSRSFWGTLFSAILYGVGGFLVLLSPAASALTMTLLLAPLFIVIGLQKIFLSISLQFRQWGWTCASGVAGLIVGIMIWNQLPSAALWVFGTLVGVEMLCAGISALATGFALKSLPKPPIEMRTAA